MIKCVCVYMCIFFILKVVFACVSQIADGLCVFEMCYGSICRLNKLCAMAGVFEMLCAFGSGRSVRLLSLWFACHSGIIRQRSAPLATPSAPPCQTDPNVSAQ